MDKITKEKLREETGKLMSFCKHNQEALDRLCQIIHLLKLEGSEVK